MFGMFDGIATLANTVISRIWPDKTEQQKEQFALEFQRELAASEAIKGQLEINTAEASNPNLFVAGWRPWIGWGLGSIIILYAFLYTGMNLAVAMGYHVIQMPPLDPMVRDIIMGMLGLNISARTFEKWKGCN